MNESGDSSLVALARDFESTLLGLCKWLSINARWTPTRMLQLIGERGGVRAAKALLASDRVQSGLIRLWELGELGRSVEVCVLNPRFGPLFSDDDRAEARRRLLAYEYSPDA